jgi:hypothetical protein
MGLSAEGFFGAGSVGGEARVNALSADRFSMSIHVTAPLPIGMTDELREAGGFRSADGQLHGGSVQRRSHVDADEPSPYQPTVILTVPRPGVLIFGSVGMGYDGRI